MKSIVITLIAIALIGAAWFFVSPLFIDEVVDEPFPGGLPTQQQIAEMAPDARNELMEQMMDKAAAAPAVEVDEPMDMQTPETPLKVATGRFTDADAIHKGSGVASLYRLPDGSHVVRLEDFQVTNGPALVVLLASVPDPQSADEVKRGYIKIDDLKGNKGNQNYEIPADINVGRYRSVVIWCELFDVLFSAAPLNVT